MLDDDAFEDIGDVFATIRGGLEEVEDFLPLHDRDRVLLLFEQPAHGVLMRAIGLVLEPIDLDRRLGHAWSLAGPGPVLQVGMDTPQVGADGLDAAMAALAADGVDAVFGPAPDGGWWTVGMRSPVPSAFVGVPTSRHDTARPGTSLCALSRAISVS